MLVSNHRDHGDYGIVFVVFVVRGFTWIEGMPEDSDQYAAQGGRRGRPYTDTYKVARLRAAGR